MSQVQDCQQCGKCCEKWGWDQNGILEDLIPWIEGRRYDILRHVSVILAGKRVNGAVVLVEDFPRIVRIYYWVDPSGNKLPIFRTAGRW